MQAVEEIESQRNRDQADQNREAQGRGHRQIRRLQVIDNERIYFVRDVLEAIDHIL